MATNTRSPRLYQTKLSLDENKVKLGSKVFDRSDCKVVFDEGSTESAGRLYLDVGNEHSFQITWR